jgi:hypothetical protein
MLGRRSATTGVKPDGMVRMPLGLSRGIVSLHASKNLARPQDLPAGHQLNFRQTAQTSRLDAGGQTAYFFQKSRSGINTRQVVIFH